MQSLVALPAEAQHRILGFITLHPQASDGLSRAFTIFREFMGGTFELRPLGELEIGAA